MKSIAKARSTIAKAFRDDPDFRRGYVDNVACILIDRLEITDKEQRDMIAGEIIRLLFES